MMGCLNVCTKLQIHPLLVVHLSKTQAFQLGGFPVKKKSSISFIKLKPHHHYYSTSSFHCRSQLSSEEIAHVASAAYGVLLLGGGLFACTSLLSLSSLSQVYKMGYLVIMLSSIV